ncbi:MAG: ribosome recycling factor, partial [Myxococcota bacterium]
MNEEVREVLDDCRQSMSKSIDSLNSQLSRIRTGRANLSVLDSVHVEYYGSATPLNQVAALTVADPRLITVKPWDKSLMSLIEKAILMSDVGMTPSSDGELIRLPIPPLTGERRKELVKQVKRVAEDSKVSVRNARRDARDMVDAIDNLPEDDSKRAKDSVQALTDDFVGK